MVASRIILPPSAADTVDEAPQSRILAAGLTDTGLERDANEDALGRDDVLGLFVVCDGMGGHAAGEVASSMAVDAILDEFSKRDRVTPMAADNCHGALSVVQQSALRSSVRRAHNAITTAQNNDSARHGMGTTLVALKVTASDVLIAHVGDSRVYRWRADTGLERATRDHSLFNRMLDDGMLPPRAAEADFDQRNVIMRALGTRDHRAEINVSPRTLGDIYLLCSDGLSDMLTDSHIERIMDVHRSDLASAAAALVDAANQAGGLDNITVLLVEIAPLQPFEDSRLSDTIQQRLGRDADKTDPHLMVVPEMMTQDDCQDGPEWMSLDQAIDSCMSGGWTYVSA